ncbi:unnamed protein product, partial [Prorocentrum cordatum]
GEADDGDLMVVHGRFWGQTALLHAVFSAVISAIKNDMHQNLVWSVLVETSITYHVHAIGLQYARFSPAHGLLMEVDPSDDFRVRDAVNDLVDDRWSFWTETPAAEHAIILISRIRCIQTVV